mgnify:FL=1
MSYRKKDKFIINGGNKLYGTIKVQTSKNATLPIMSASLLTTESVKINSCPDILDVQNMIKILKKLGAKVERIGDDYVIDNSQIDDICLDYNLCKTMRSSIFLLGSILARFKTMSLTMPGGCKIGERPIDIHIDAFKRLGVKVVELDDFIFFNAEHAKANKIKLKIPSVGATENIVQFASTLKGKTTIYNAAREPEVVDLCNFLIKMGANIKGAGTNKITIFGVDRLKGVEYRPIPDRIVLGTLLIATAICGGVIQINNAILNQNEKLIDILLRMGCQINIKNDIITISRETPLKSIKSVSTGYFPDFPTDLQSLMLTLSCIVKGKTQINEKIFENRFLIVDELKKMGAKIQIIDNHTAIVEGVHKLSANKIKALDLRGGASLVLAGLAAEGRTIIENVHFIDRGYCHLESMLASLGADIKRI